MAGGNMRPYDITQDPAFAQGMSNIAKLFAPPSPQDVLAGAKVQQMKEEAARRESALQQLDPGLRPYVDAGIDEGAIKGYVLGDAYKRYQANPQAQPSDFDTPMYLLHGNAGNTFQGVNLAQAGQDRRNAADNTRYLQERILQEAGQDRRNAADNTRAMDQTRLQQQTERDKFLQGDVRLGTGDQVYLSPQRQAALGVSTGTLTGPQKAPTMGEGYIAPDGSRGMYRMGDNGVPVDAMTGAPLPAGSMPMRAVAQGTPDQFGKLTETQGKYALFASRAAQANETLDATLASPYGQNLQNLSLGNAVDYVAGLGDKEGAMSQVLSNAAISPEAREYYQSAQSFLTAILRPDTGAAVTPKEFQMYSQIFIPMPGDDPATVRRKNEARKLATQALGTLSNGGARQIATQLANAGMPVPDELAKIAATQGAGTAPAANNMSAPPVQQPQQTPSLPAGVTIRLKGP